MENGDALYACIAELDYKKEFYKDLHEGFAYKLFLEGKEFKARIAELEKENEKLKKKCLMNVWLKEVLDAHMIYVTKTKEDGTYVREESVYRLAEDYANDKRRLTVPEDEDTEDNE